MLWRCKQTSGHFYRFYGSSGITVCERWAKYDNFVTDMGEKPAGLTLERIDNNGNYEPENCRWATMKEQSMNRRNTRYITIDGVTKTVAQWIEEVKPPDMTLQTLRNKLRFGEDKFIECVKFLQG